MDERQEGKEKQRMKGRKLREKTHVRNCTQPDKNFK